MALSGRPEEPGRVEQDELDDDKQETPGLLDV